MILFRVQKKKNLSLFIHTDVVPNLYDFSLLKEGILMNVGNQMFRFPSTSIISKHTMEINGNQSSSVTNTLQNIYWCFTEESKSFMFGMI